MPVNHRKLKYVIFDVDGSTFQSQLSDWKLNNDTDDAEEFHTYDPDSSFAEEADPSWSIECKFYADWRSGGVSDFLFAHDGETLTCTIDHHPDIVGEHVRFTVPVLIKAPSVGGETRTTELTETTLKCVGAPDYGRIG